MFECNAIADPMHEVSWSFTSTSGIQRDKIASTVDGDATSKYGVNRDRNSTTFGELRVNNVLFEDRGTYTCMAANRIGSEEASANLTVHGKWVGGQLSGLMGVYTSSYRC